MKLNCKDESDIHMNEIQKIFERISEKFKKQKTFNEYLKLQQQKEQTVLKYLRKLKNQLFKLNNDAKRLKILLMKFQLKLLLSNKNHLVFLFLKNNYNVNKQAA